MGRKHREPSTPGREPALTRKDRAVGIDIGSTKMAIALVDSRGAILQRIKLATEAGRGFPRAVERLTAAVTQVLERAGWAPGDISGIGIGCAGPKATS